MSNNFKFAKVLAGKDSFCIIKDESCSFYYKNINNRYDQIATIDNEILSRTEVYPYVVFSFVIMASLLELERQKIIDKDQYNKAYNISEKVSQSIWKEDREQHRLECKEKRDTKIKEDLEKAKSIIENKILNTKFQEYLNNKKDNTNV